MSRCAHDVKTPDGTKKEIGWDDVKKILLEEARKGNQAVIDLINSYCDKPEETKNHGPIKDLQERMKGILKSMKSRCENPSNPAYCYYGGRGIKCLITKDDLAYLWNRDNADLLKKPSVDRIDNNGNYCVSNCRFIESSLNSRYAARRKYRLAS